MHLTSTTALLALILRAAAAVSIPSSTSSSDLSLSGEEVVEVEGIFGRPYPNKVLLIRHGEKPSDGGPGLSKAGVKRAKCLRKVFGPNSHHNVGLILAQSYNPRTGMRERPYRTVFPLAQDLGLEVRTDCERDDAACVRSVVAEFAKRSDKNILICWKHSFLHEVAEALGAKKTSPYPDLRFDLVWTIHKRMLVSKESEQCEGLDDGLGGRHDPEVELPHFAEEAEWDDDEWLLAQGSQEQLTLEQP